MATIKFMKVKGDVARGRGCGPHHDPSGRGHEGAELQVEEAHSPRGAFADPEALLQLEVAGPPLLGERPLRPPQIRHRALRLDPADGPDGRPARRESSGRAGDARVLRERAGCDVHLAAPSLRTGKSRDARGMAARRGRHRGEGARGRGVLRPRVRLPRVLSRIQALRVLWFARV